MRVLVILKASENSEAAVPPQQEDIEKMISFNEEMVKAEILKSADGLKPSKFGKRVVYRPHRKPSVTDGPFAETKEQSASETHIELRTFWEPEDFAQAMTPEMEARVEEMQRAVGSRT